MNIHDLSDLEAVARSLRHHYGSTLVVRDPQSNNAINIVMVLESVVANVQMDERGRHAPRGRNVRKAYLPKRELVQVKSTRAMQDQAE